MMMTMTDVDHESGDDNDDFGAAIDDHNISGFDDNEDDSGVDDDDGDLFFFRLTWVQEET